MNFPVGAQLHDKTLIWEEIKAANIWHHFQGTEWNLCSPPLRHTRCRDAGSALYFWIPLTTCSTETILVIVTDSADVLCQPSLAFLISST